MAGQWYAIDVEVSSRRRAWESYHGQKNIPGTENPSVHPEVPCNAACRALFDRLRRPAAVIVEMLMLDSLDSR
jgi:hypothetical protein